MLKILGAKRAEDYKEVTDTESVTDQWFLPYYEPVGFTLSRTSEFYTVLLRRG